MDKKLRIKIIQKDISIPDIAEEFKVSRQYVYQVILKGYPATGKTKKILDRFYKLLK